MTQQEQAPQESQGQNQSLYRLVPIKEAVQEYKDYLDSIHSGKVKTLDTGYPKINATMMKGWEPGTLWLLGGMPGSGKSAFVNELETNLCMLNHNVAILNFSLEMPGYKQVARKVSKDTRVTVKDQHDSSFGKKDTADIYSRFDITYVEGSVAVKDITALAFDFWKRKLREYKGNVRVVFIIDHALMTDDDGQERIILKNLSKSLIKIKLKTKGNVILLTQLNRNAEAVERIQIPALHYPMKQDIYGSEAMFQASDYVSVLDAPYKRGITEYGPTKLDGNKIYMHFLKCRDGDPFAMEMGGDIKYNTLQ